jgi:autotransporter-associated beta strand protein
LVLTGEGSATLGGIANFETANVASGIWTLAAPLRVANGLTISAGATVVGSTEQFASPIVANGTLQLDVPNDVTFSGTIGGNGQLIKSGTGTLTLGNQGFSGSTLISLGRLALAGDMQSAMTVARGGTLTGRGVILGLLVQSGGVVAPGNAANTGTLTITGNYVQNAGATYLTRAIGGTFDTIVIGGTATLDNGAILNITANGTGIGRYTLLRADGGLTGTYSVVQADITGAYSLIYGSNSVMLNIGRSNQALLALAQGRNGLAVASSVIQLPQASQLYTALVTADDATVAGAYEQLAGNIYAAVPAAMIHGVDLVSGAALKRTGSSAGLQLWGQLLGSTGDMSGSGLLAHVEQRSYGGLIGVEGALGNVVVGVAGGYVHTKLRQETADARTKMPQALLYARAVLPHIEMQAGIGYSRASNIVSRSISFADFGTAEQGRYKADVIHGYGELGVPVKLGDGAVTPFAAGRFYRVDSNGLTEVGGAAGLRIDDSAHWSGMSELGTRLSSPIVHGLSAYGRLSWQHRIGSYDNPVRASFVAGGSQFEVDGAQLSKDAASLGLGLGWTGTHGLMIAAGYDATLGNRGHDNAGRVTLSIPL